MVRYTIRFKPSAARQFRRMDRPVQVRLSSAIEALASNPRPHGVKRMQGQEDLFLVRAGDYRILYQIVDDRLLVLVVRVGHRRPIYR